MDPLTERAFTYMRAWRIEPRSLRGVDVLLAFREAYAQGYEHGREEGFEAGVEAGIERGFNIWGPD